MIKMLQVNDRGVYAGPIMHLSIADLMEIAQTASQARQLRTPGGDALAAVCEQQARNVMEAVTLLRAAELYARATLRAVSE